MKYIDLTMQRFGKLTAIKYSHSDKLGKAVWLFKCDCGEKVKIPTNSVKSGNTKSCGCFKIYVAKNQFLKHGMLVNGKTQRFYRIFQHIKSRCNNPKQNLFENYGGRGIKCLWSSFEEFRNDMHGSYLAHIKKFGEKNTSINRIDNDKNYRKENCRWATFSEQSRNTSRNLIISYNGKTMCLMDWSKKLKIRYTTLKGRINRNWPIEKALTIPVK